MFCKDLTLKCALLNAIFELDLTLKIQYSLLGLLACTKCNRFFWLNIASILIQNAIFSLLLARDALLDIQLAVC